MDMLVVILRLVHIVLGALWVGMMAFTTFFLTPAIREAGPEGGAVMVALQRRGVMTVMPVIALLTLISGVWLVLHVYGGMAGLMASRVGVAYAIGGAVALLAFILGIAVVRPAMARGDAARGAAAGRVVALLLILAAGAMAVARYL